VGQIDDAVLGADRPELPNANPDDSIEPRFVNGLERAGFFHEMSQQYGK
jgi:hypothetical protein